ncbi:unnamed protein product [Psylliodes chrysocephalus]|uniref:Uncharacterized protein n=1 Tax=Psylliodes chrysocephalus TaxID=3402493 RepID=A0A9P0CW84_9CUCU|nr:unnamed protein product [Psylliodes chrysocephala]
MDTNEAETGLLECNKAVRRINHNLKIAATLDEKQRLCAALANIKSHRSQIKNFRKKGSRIHTGVITNLQHKDPKTFLQDCKSIFERKIHNTLQTKEAIKVNVVLCGEFVLSKAEFKYFTTSNSPIYKDTNIGQWFDEKVNTPILNELEEIQERDSGWALKQVVNLGVNINKFTPQLGSSYIDLPSQIKQKKCINIKNDDQACFAWSVTAALYPVIKNSQRYKSKVEFKNFKNKERVPFIVYADLESVLNPMEDKNIYQQHVPAAVGYYFKYSYDDTISFYRSYRGSDCMQWFTDEMKKLAEDLETLFWCPFDIDISAEQEYDFQKSTHCHICEKPFEPYDKKGYQSPNKKLKVKKNTLAVKLNDELQDIKKYDLGLLTLTGITTNLQHSDNASDIDETIENVNRQMQSLSSSDEEDDQNLTPITTSKNDFGESDYNKIESNGEVQKRVEEQVVEKNELESIYNPSHESLIILEA